MCALLQFNLRENFLENSAEFDEFSLMMFGQNNQLPAANCQFLAENNHTFNDAQSCVLANRRVVYKSYNNTNHENIISNNYNIK